MPKCDRKEQHFQLAAINFQCLSGLWAILKKKPKIPRQKIARNSRRRVGKLKCCSWLENGSKTKQTIKITMLWHFPFPFENKVVIVKNSFSDYERMHPPQSTWYMYVVYGYIYDIALMPLDALSAIAFDLPPNEFSIRHKIHIFIIAPFVSVLNVPQLCQQRALEMASPTRMRDKEEGNSNGLQCLTKVFSLKADREQLAPSSSFLTSFVSLFALCNEFIIVHVLLAHFSSI